MVSQYPHYLFRVTTSAATRDNNGNYQQGVTGLEYLCRCRAELGGKGNKVVSNGEVIVATATLYLPLNGVMVNAGENVVVSTDAQGQNLRIKGEAIGVSTDQMNQRIWL